MTQSTQDTKEKIKKTPKAKGPIRFEAIVPITIIVVLTWAYFFFFFDSHLKKAIEIGGYHALGAEVNVAQVKTSVSDFSLSIKGLQVTDAQSPDYNLFEIGEIRFRALWDALLRAKFVVNEAAIQDIGISTKRTHTGKVKPPEPPKPEDNEPSAVAKEADKLKDKALDKVEDEYNENILGDLASVAGGVDANEQLKKIEGELKSKQKAKELEVTIKEKQTYWNEKFKTLPKESELKALNDRLKNVKTSNFKNPQELEQSLKEIDKILKEADSHVKNVSAMANELDKDVKMLDQGIKDLNQMIKDDVKALEQRMKLPSFEGDKLVKALLYPYIQPYIGKFQYYHGLAKKYLPPNIIDKNKKAEAKSEQVQPHPRASGTTYEFGKQNAYPLVWVKRTAINSKANPEKGFGDLAGEITNITTHQKLIQKPTVFNLKGDFPAQSLKDFLVNIVLDKTGEKMKVALDFGIGSYLIDSKTLTSSPDVNIAFTKAQGMLKLTALMNPEIGFAFDMQNEMTQTAYDISAKSKDLEQILKNVFTNIPMLNLNVKGEGNFPKIPLHITSNLGKELEKGFSREINAKIEEAKAKIKTYVDEQINSQKNKIEEDIAKIKAQYENEVKKINEQINAQKKQADEKVTQAKKDAENQVNREKKKAEDELKKKLGKDAQKAAEELKKKMGIK